MVRFIEIAVRLLGVYGLVLIGPEIIAAFGRMSSLDLGMRGLVVILSMVVGSVIPGLLWVTAPRIAQAATRGIQNDQAISFNLSLQDALFLSIILAGLVVLCSAATNLGEVVFWFARRPPETQPNELLLRFQYDLFVHEHLAMLGVRSILGCFLVLRARPITDKILEKSGKGS